MVTRFVGRLIAVIQALPALMARGPLFQHAKAGCACAVFPRCSRFVLSLPILCLSASAAPEFSESAFKAGEATTPTGSRRCCARRRAPAHFAKGGRSQATIMAISISSCAAPAIVAKPDAIAVVQEEGGEEPITIGNPVPVLDESTDHIHLIFTRENDRVFHTVSTDEGKTQSGARRSPPPPSARSGVGSRRAGAWHPARAWRASRATGDSL